MVTNPVRREILAILAREETMTRTELAAVLASDDNIPGQDARSFEISLHHNHLPKLEDGQYIEYDARTEDIVLWKDPQQIRSQLHD
ncbi:helix-turn-helix domain-containing protein [Halorussus aquaticus]|uniref:Helix-turn-helix domain-containing protein n=1 Tax=Halorussus aquaticus TaxID=2953748 RepID=A0ABD5Q572_9EURY|nr:helix-turn-helix domain-containing protein [Halorussus aquaticus]